ncbi:MAG TPA: hypothetical protein VHN20_05780 [Beijerinckiaceae bacterium]|nr:hypothetical protein [Beijerinckiaceae bacterium]
MDMRQVRGETIWEPEILSRMALDARRFMYGVKAPFDMPADIPDLIDTIIVLDGAPFVIRGVTGSMPAKAIAKDDVIALLVRAL